MAIKVSSSFIITSEKGFINLQRISPLSYKFVAEISNFRKLTIEADFVKRPCSSIKLPLKLQFSTWRQWIRHTSLRPSSRTPKVRPSVRLSVFCAGILFFFQNRLRKQFRMEQTTGYKSAPDSLQVLVWHLTSFRGLNTLPIDLKARQRNIALSHVKTRNPYSWGPERKEEKKAKRKMISTWMIPFLKRFSVAISKILSDAWKGMEWTSAFWIMF